MLPHKAMPYIKYKYGYASYQTKPDVLVAGDSYWWCMVGDDIPCHVFKRDEYWFYNRDVYKRNIKQEKGVSEISFAEQTVNRDVIILMATEATFDLFPYGFIDKAYNVYCLGTNEKRKLIEKQIEGNAEWKNKILAKAKENHISDKEQFDKDVDYILEKEYMPVKKSKIAFNAIIKEYEEKIEKDAAWYAQIKQKALQNQIPVEEQLNLDAEFVYESEYGSDEVKQELKEIRKRIRKDAGWMEQIKKKATEKNISIEEMIELDAKYVYDTEVKEKK